MASGFDPMRRRRSVTPTKDPVVSGPARIGALPMPSTIQGAQDILTRYKLTGLEVTEIAEDRLYCLSTGKPQKASTVILLEEGENVRALHVRGWVVNDNAPGAWEPVKG
jgi:hypothetical protein